MRAVTSATIGLRLMALSLARHVSWTPEHFGRFARVSEHAADRRLRERLLPGDRALEYRFLALAFDVQAERARGNEHGQRERDARLAGARRAHRHHARERVGLDRFF